MITLIPYNTLGHHDYGWLNARYHFSFGQYHDPARMGFHGLRVINDDIIQPGRGFAAHPHDNMEIVTYVRRGAITHKDSAGNEGRTEAGDVQVMSAGSGIVHAEHNHENVETALFQIWIMPRERDVTPRWDAMKFPKTPANGALPLLVSGKEDGGSGALRINADASIYGGTLAEGAALTQKLSGPAYLVVSEGRISLDGHDMGKGDGARITDVEAITLEAREASEVVLIELA